MATFAWSALPSELHALIVGRLECADLAALRACDRATRDTVDKHALTMRLRGWAAHALQLGERLPDLMATLLSNNLRRLEIVVQNTGECSDVCKFLKRHKNAFAAVNHLVLKCVEGATSYFYRDNDDMFEVFESTMPAVTHIEIDNCRFLCDMISVETIESVTVTNNSFDNSELTLPERWPSLRRLCLCKRTSIWVQPWYEHRDMQSTQWSMEELRLEDCLFQENVLPWFRAREVALIRVSLGPRNEFNAYGDHHVSIMESLDIFDSDAFLWFMLEQMPPLFRGMRRMSLRTQHDDPHDPFRIDGMWQHVAPTLTELTLRGAFVFDPTELAKLSCLTRLTCHVRGDLDFLMSILTSTSASDVTLVAVGDCSNANDTHQLKMDQIVNAHPKRIRVLLAAGFHVDVEHAVSLIDTSSA